MTRVREAFSNGAWRTWLLGIVATLITTIIVNGISFQRETRESIATNEQRIKAIETTSRATIIREFDRQDKLLNEAAQRVDRRLDALERRIEALEKK
jgi:hypothetical protein